MIEILSLVFLLPLDIIFQGWSWQQYYAKIIWEAIGLVSRMKWTFLIFAT